MKRWIAIPGVTSSGINDMKNRITIGIDIGLKAAEKRRVVEAVERVLERLDIPREAVILEEMPPAVPKGAENRRTDRHLGRSGPTEIGRERLLVRILGKVSASRQSNCRQDDILSVGETTVGLRGAVYK